MWAIDAPALKACSQDCAISSGVTGTGNLVGSVRTPLMEQVTTILSLLGVVVVAVVAVVVVAVAAAAVAVAAVAVVDQQRCDFAHRWVLVATVEKRSIVGCC
jgi:hypothetical protein